VQTCQKTALTLDEVMYEQARRSPYQRMALLRRTTQFGLKQRPGLKVMAHSGHAPRSG